TTQPAVLGAPDVAVVSVSAAGPLFGGQAGRIDVLVRNLGSLTSTATTLVLTSDFGTALTSDSPKPVPALAPTNGVTLSFHPGALPAAASGNHSFTARLTPSVPNDSNTANDSLAQAFAVTRGIVDLKIVN